MLNRVPSWAECHAAGMTAAQAAAARGRDPSSAASWARRRGLRFADGRKTPEFQAHLKRISAMGVDKRAERLRRMNADPEVQARRIAGLRAVGPQIAARVAAHRARTDWRNALSPQELADYKLLMKHHYRRAEALKAIGREDLI